MKRVPALLHIARNYTEVFDDKYDKDLYACCILIDRQVASYFEAEALTKDEKRDLRYYVGTIVCAVLANKSHPSISEIAALAKICVLPIDPTILESCADLAISAYKKLGATDKVAKSVSMRTETLRLLEQRLGAGTALVVP